MEIELRTLTKSFGKVDALSHLTCTIPPSTLGAIIGLNGAGKTTLLQILAGILMPNKGQVLYDTNPFSRVDIPFRRRICFLPDFLPVLAHFSALRHAAMVFELYGKDIEPHMDELMELYDQLDLLPLLEAPLETLSRGQLYKAGLVPLWVIDPELWLVDEPFAAGMDPNGIRIFKEQARRHVEKGGTLLFTTQIMEVVENFADRIYILHQGECIQQASVAEWQHLEGGVSGEVGRLIESLRHQDG